MNSGIRAWAFWSGKLPFLVIGAVFLWSALVILSRRAPQGAGEMTTIRIAHWQLEPGVREALDEAAADYQKIHPRVRVRQEAVPEGTYAQWLTTQMIGGQAPDIVEVGMLPAPQTLAFYARYMVPVTPYVFRPNPYNRGTDLEREPLIRTFKDGMRSSYINELQEFYTVPLGLVSMRLFYNRDLLEELTGSGEAPADYRGFLRVCGEIAAKRDADGRSYIPIAGSAYHFRKGWESNLVMPLTYDALRRIDFNRDGLFGREEMFLGFLSGRVGFHDPAYEKSFRILRELTAFFPHGWTGLNRDEALFNFAQRKAVFLCTGLWEAEGIAQQAEGKFEIGVMDFPLPGPEDPEYGDIALGPRYESPDGGMPMAVTNMSRSPETAVDFLLFLAARVQNEKFNRKIRWIPITVGARAAPGLDVFEPHLEGMVPAFDANLGPESLIKWEQVYSLYQIGQISYEGMAEAFSRFYTMAGREDFREFVRNQVRGGVQRGQFAAGLREKALAAGAPEDGLEWIRYRAAMNGLILGEIGTAKMNRFLEDPAALQTLRDRPLFQYSGEALRNIRRAAKEEGK